MIDLDKLRETVARVSKYDRTLTPAELRLNPDLTNITMHQLPAIVAYEDDIRLLLSAATLLASPEVQAVFEAARRWVSIADKYKPGCHSTMPVLDASLALGRKLQEQEMLIAMRGEGE